MLVKAMSVPDGRKEEEEEKVQAEAGGSQDEDTNVPEGRKMEEAGKVPGGRDGKDGDKDARIIPEGREEAAPSKTSSKESKRKVVKEKEMKKKHTNITPPPAQDATNFETKAAKEIEN